MKKVSQLRIVIALNFVIIALMAGLMFYPELWTVQASPPTKTYEKIRPGEISLNPYLCWELDMGGTGDLPLKCFSEDESLYIFGNSAAQSNDLPKSGGFLAKCSIYGVTEDFVSLGGALKSVCRYENGFLAAIEGDCPYLVKISKNGKTEVIDGFCAQKEEVIEIKYYSQGYLLITRFGDESGRHALKCAFFSHALDYLGSTTAISPLDLSYCASAVFGDRIVIFANAYGSDYYPAVIETERGGSAMVSLLEAYPGKIYGMAARENGEILLLHYGTTSGFIRYTRSPQGYVRLIQAKPTGLYCDDEIFYAFYEDTALAIDGDLKVLASFDSYPIRDDSYIGRYFVAASGNKIRVFCDGKATDAVVDGEAHCVEASKNGLFCVYVTDSGFTAARLRDLFI